MAGSIRSWTSLREGLYFDAQGCRKALLRRTLQSLRRNGVGRESKWQLHWKAGLKKRRASPNQTASSIATGPRRNTGG